jgi:CRISPR-associated protein Csx3
MTVFNLNFDQTTQTLKIGFGGDTATGDKIIKAINDGLKALDLPGGPGVVKVTGPVTTPGAAVLGHLLAHKFAAVGFWDPKLQKFLIAITHDPKWDVGDLID